MSTTQKDLAEQLGMSVRSVRRALNGHPKVSAESRLRVLEVAQRFNYDENSNKGARVLAAKSQGRPVKHNVIAVVMSCDLEQHTNPFFAELLDGIELGTTERRLDVFQFRRREGLLPRLVRDAEVDGVVSFFWDPELDHQLLGLKVPVVMIGRHSNLFNNLIPDSCGGTALATQYLIDLGHREIAYVGLMLDSHEGVARYRSYCDTLEKNELLVDTGKIDVSVPMLGSSFAAVAIDNLLDNDQSFRSAGRPGFTAVVCYNDLHGMGVVTRLQQRGLNVPGDISVVGFDDSSWRGFSPALTSIAFDRVGMGRRAVEIISSVADNPNLPTELIKEVFPVELCVRESTAPPRKPQ